MKSLYDERLAAWKSRNVSKGECCEHKHVEFFRESDGSGEGKFVCSSCHNTITSEEHPAKVDEEEGWMKKLGGEDNSIPGDSSNRGMTIEFLVELCTFFNLWK